MITKGSGLFSQHNLRAAAEYVGFFFFPSPDNIHLSTLLPQTHDLPPPFAALLTLYPPPHSISSILP